MEPPPPPPPPAPPTFPSPAPPALRLAPNATLHYIPVPKTGSEATRRFLGRFDEVFHHIGTHKMNVGLPRIERPWDEAKSVRVATWRDPVERFLSTLRALLESGPAGPNAHPSDRPYNTILPIPFNRTMDALVADRAAMQKLAAGAGSGHFLPQHRFLLSRDRCLTVHFLVDFRHLQTALPALASWLGLTVRHPGWIAKPFERVNDVTRGEHEYTVEQPTRNLLLESYAGDYTLHDQAILGDHRACRPHRALAHVRVCTPWCQPRPVASSPQ
jgi:hypothetical protein